MSDVNTETMNPETAAMEQALNNQPDMTPEQAEQAAFRFARQCGRDVATGEMSLTTFVEKLLPFARVDRQWIKAAQSKELWVERNTSRTAKLSAAYHDKTNPDGNSKAANGSKLKQPLKLANSVDYTEELLADTLSEIARLKRAGEDCTSPYPAFVNVCRAQLARTDNRLTKAEIAAIVCPEPKVSTELSKLEAAEKALKAAQKIREDAGFAPDANVARAETIVTDRIATLKQVALIEKVRTAAIAAGLTVV